METTSARALLKRFCAWYMSEYRSAQSTSWLREEAILFTYLSITSYYALTGIWGMMMMASHFVEPSVWAGYGVSGPSSEMPSLARISMLVYMLSLTWFEFIGSLWLQHRNKFHCHVSPNFVGQQQQFNSVGFCLAGTGSWLMYYCKKGPSGVNRWNGLEEFNVKSRLILYLYVY